MVQQLRFIRYLALTLIYIVTLILIGQYISGIVQYTYNSTTSERPGYYLLYPASIKVGGIYQICLDEYHQEFINIMIKIGLKPTGNCKKGNMALLKEVIAGPEDLIQITNLGIMVNNKLLPDSKGIESYKGIQLKRLSVGLSYKLAPNEYWLYGHGQSSYDSRYFGVVNDREIGKKAVWISF
ncbi:MAG: traF [Burkholderiales bacterium]|jgi:type IV secretory pathway protease TraF|nr:traF [Burkholderiales bacterium]